MHDDEARVLQAVPAGPLVGGRWRETDATFKVEDPATGEVLTEVGDAGRDDARAALDAAVAAQERWAATAPRQRAEILRKAFELMTERKADLALLMTLEMGKPLAESEAEVAYAAEFFRWFSEEACRIDGGYAVNPAGAGRMLVMRQPVGPCYLITPWNFPLAMGTRKIGPAFAAGCTAIVKPAGLTPLSMLALGQILLEAGLPEGVLSILPTSSSSKLSAPLFADGRLRKLSFTGSTEVGQALLKQAADGVLRVSMELGGNAPFVVFDDADLDAAVEGAMVAKMRNIGEACTSANRFLVQQGIADAFAARLTERMSALKVGRGTEPGVQVGPLIDADAQQRVAGLVDEAVARGAEVRTGGHARAGAGHFFEPTVVTGVDRQDRLTREEIFGPVAAIQTFTDEDEAVASANDTVHGLVTYLFTENLKRALRVCERLETGMIGLNQGMVSNPAAPFGGVKQSGLGREGGRVGIDEYLEVKYVAVNLG
jgi:succinate-semialdehyde dehydrogenase/glutarate-semialdehyde dehydrogenase